MLAVCCQSDRGKGERRTDGGLGGRVDDGEAAPERGLPPSPADEKVAARDRRRCGHGDAFERSCHGDAFERSRGAPCCYCCCYARPPPLDCLALAGLRGLRQVFGGRTASEEHEKRERRVGLTPWRTPAATFLIWTPLVLVASRRPWG